MQELNQTYWQSRYQDGRTGWDIGYPSPPLVEYVIATADRSSKILLPGAGNAYEASYLYDRGFRNVFVLDVAPAPLEHLLERNPDFPERQVLQQDFFAHYGHYDLILEQTFFCALDPAQRQAYVRHMHELLRPAGRLAGVLFTFPLSTEGPPFGGSEAEYRERFAAHFRIRKMGPCYNSIKPRLGSECFFELEKQA